MGVNETAHDTWNAHFRSDVTRSSALLQVFDLEKQGTTGSAWQKVAGLPIPIYLLVR